MRRIVTWLVVSNILLANIAPVSAWSDAGHKIVASIAFRQLTPKQQERIVAVLRHHPRFQDDFETLIPDDLRDGRPANRNEWLFQQAAVWPDMARSFADEDRQAYHRPSWHYINLPFFLNNSDRMALEDDLEVNRDLQPPTYPKADMNVIQTIRLSRQILSDTHGDRADKGLMLAWLMHTVGDVHQPLHSTALFSRSLFPKGDHGGNSIPTEQKNNLHAVWDGFLGGRVKFNDARKGAAAMLDDISLRKLGEKAASSLDEKDWLNESHVAAIATAYDAKIVVLLRGAEADGDTHDLDAIDLTDDYLRAGGRIAKQRVTEAGYRLGEILKKIAADNP